MVEFISGCIIGLVSCPLLFMFWVMWSSQFDGNTFELPILERDMELRHLRYRERAKRRALKKAAMRDSEWDYTNATAEYQKARSAVAARRLELRSPVCEKQQPDRYEFP